jgi:hypothetical protein
MYQWSKDYGASSPNKDELESIPHLTRYWDGMFNNANVPEGVGLLKPTMSQSRWLDTFVNKALPLLRNNRNLFNYDGRH